MAKLDIWVVRRTPRAMTRTAIPLPSLRTSLLTSVAVTGLSVEAGLLNSSSLGLVVSVCVTYRCRRRLLDRPIVRLLRWLPILPYSVVLISVLLIPLSSPECRPMLCMCRLQVMPLKTDPGKGPGPRKITDRCTWILTGLMLGLSRPTLLGKKWTLFLQWPFGQRLRTWPK